jgi:bifunctional DNase/RNase
MIVPVELSRIAISENSPTHVIWLKEKNGQRTFPILIGVFEALAIERHLRKESFPRPLTHDLLAKVIKTLNGTLQQVVVTDIQNSTFFAKLVITQNSHTFEIDSRPSDAIALATQMNAPIFVEEQVFGTVCSPEVLLGTIEFKMPSPEKGEDAEQPEDWRVNAEEADETDEETDDLDEDDGEEYEDEEEDDEEKY